MLRKFVLPLVAAGALAGGISLGAASASAQPMYGGGYAVGGGSYTTSQYVRHHHKHRLHKVCRPEFKWVKVWSRYGWHWKRVFVGIRCHWVRW